MNLHVFNTWKGNEEFLLITNKSLEIISLDKDEGKNYFNQKIINSIGNFDEVLKRF